MKQIPVKCPHCEHNFEIEVNLGSLMAKGTGSEARQAAQKKPRPGAQGKAKPRKKKITQTPEESPV